MNIAFLGLLLYLIASPWESSFLAGPGATPGRDRSETDIRFLASDELRGRKAGTPGGDVAARYIAEEFRSAGVQVLDAAPDYFQDVLLEEVTPPETADLRLGGRRLKWGSEFLLGSAQPVDLKTTLVRLEGGIAEAVQSQGEALKGKIPLVRFSQRSDKDRELAQAAGASAIAYEAGEGNWGGLGRYFGSPRIELGSTEPNPLPVLLLKEMVADSSPEIHLQSAGGSVGRLKSPNVVGWIPGTDPEAAREFVLLTAHYDHVGEDPDLAKEGKGDTIFNGARDNAFGVAALLTAARKLGGTPARRPVIVMATTAEEQGLLGSRFYVQHPIVPLAETVFVLNTDGGGFPDTDIVTVIGLDRTTAGPMIEKASRSAGLDAFRGGEDSQPLFNRSDNVVFARIGIPAVTFSGGFRTFGPESMPHYHRPSDEVGPDFDFAYLEHFSRAFADSARRIADAPRAPRWSAGDAFEAAARGLYGSSR